MKDCVVELEPDLTLLVGRNNAGKSRVLRALAIALGAAVANRDDLTIGNADPATIDVVLAPAKSGLGDEIFDDRLARRLNSVQAVSDDPIRERFAWRTTIATSDEGSGVRTDRGLLVFDTSAQRWAEPNNPATPNFDQRGVVAVDLVETRRDLADELARRGSSIRRILDDLEIGPERRSELEKGLGTLGADIVSASKSLAAVTVSLAALAQSVDTIGQPSIKALPVRLEELARSVSIDLDTGNGELPLRFHGSGSKSLTSLQVQSVLYDRRLGRDGPILRPHPVSLVEEPEAHLHPQAQYELATVLLGMRGQVVVTTHSTHLVSVAEPRSIRILRASHMGPAILDLRPDDTEVAGTPRARRPSMHIEEMEKIRRLVERPFGEILFASAIVIGDGATERALLPPLIRSALKSRAHGVCVVDPGSMNSDYAVALVKFANLLDIPWLLFSDSDGDGVAAAQRLVDEHGSGNTDRIIWVHGSPGDGEGAATERMLIDFDKELCETACAQLGFDPERHEILAFMAKKKGVVGGLIAKGLIASHPWSDADPSCWPPALAELVAKIDGVIPRKVTSDG